MKPAPFAYHDPATLEDALELLADLSSDATPLAGGQSLIPMLNLRLATPTVVVDLRRIPGLDTLEGSSEGLRVGAMVRAATLETHVRATGEPGCLVQAIREIGHPQIRNRTTIGGNLAHADPASELPTVLVALGGTVTLESRERGRRTLDADAFFDGVFSTAREPDELVVEATFPRVEGTSVFLEVSRRPGDFCLAGACVAGIRDGDRIRDVRIAVCGVGDRPRRLDDVERLAESDAITADRLREIGDLAATSVRPHADVHASAEYRRGITGVLVRRGIERIAGVAS